MKNAITQEYLDELTLAAVRKKNIFGANICVENGEGSLSLESAAGNASENQQYFLASVTKLYVTTILLKLKFEKRIELQDKISKYLSDDITQNLHLLNGIDYSKELTIKHLLSNTSGIPDYFTSDAIKELTSGKDQAWGFDKTIASAKEKKPRFAPGKKAHYCDTNFQLLGKIIEEITGEDFNDVFRDFIVKKLGLENTYVYEYIKDTSPAPFYIKDRKLHLPQYMSSIGPEGGIVSTAKESMVFLKAFLNGHFFPKEYIEELKEWKLLFGPGLFFYGVGIASQPISLKEFKNGLIGHWGQTGSFSFYHPKTDLYFTGTVNQFYGQNAAAKMMMSLIKRTK